MTESPVQVEYMVAPPAITATTNGSLDATCGNGLPAPASSGTPPANTSRFTSKLMSARRPPLKLTLSSEDQADFSAAIVKSRGRMVSDAAKLPATTNMGLGNRPAPTASIAPASRAQPISQSQRAMIPTKQETANAEQEAYSTLSHNWEEDDAEPRAKPKPPPPSNAVFLLAIPCFFVTNVKNATTFYKEILGFETLGKPDISFASLFRASPQVDVAMPTIRRSGGAGAQMGKLDAPPGSVQLYLRLTPKDLNGVRIKPPAVTLWMLVNDVDEVFREITVKWNKFTPQHDEYFPVHLFGEAKIISKPRNTAFGTRELHIVDGDDNKIIFFKNLY